MDQKIASIMRRIQSLESQASAIKEKEKLGMIKKIKQVITIFNIEPEELYEHLRALHPSSAVSEDTKKSEKKKEGDLKKPTAPPKYIDASGRTWTGHGKRPAWFLKAIETGKTPEDLLIRHEALTE